MSSKNNLTHYDPMGKCVWDYFNGKLDAEILVHSSLEETIITGEYLFRDLNEMPKLEVLALEKAQGKILDVGACSGCHASLLHQMKRDVTACDISEYAIKTLEARNLKTLHCDVMDIKDQKFDTILLLMNGLGMAGSLEKTVEYLKHLKSLLTPNGKIIGDSADIIEAYREDDGSVLIELTGNYYGQITFQLEYEGIKGNAFEWLYLDFETLTACAKQAGLQCECLAEGDTDNYLAMLNV